MTGKLSANIAGVDFNGVLINASGVHCQTEKELDELLNDDAVAAPVTKSATLNSRDGNPKPSYFEFENGSINSMGLPNNGFEYYLKYVETHKNNKPIILSIASLSKSECVKLLKKVQDSNFNGITELNLSCPNVIGKPQVAYDFAATDEILNEVFSFFKKPLGIKLPPYFDLTHFDQIAQVLNKYPLSHVNSVNSIGNGLLVDIDTEAPVIKPKGGFGGLGGHNILPTALANVRAFRLRLNDSIKIIGTGGVKTPEDVFAHILCGADLVSIGTELNKRGIGIFRELNNGLLDIMKNKGYSSVEDFRSALKES
ncbi:dihydroorotate oxidase [Apilactobacillus ozensis]|uniref:dihydroorotate oxidase (fumarate) n=1 Tax=Apilactobacillus ozensis DSM 23829 = JCM 17196 TaxID=1423781 RepID=A0A0R2ALN6_9LACO|nr:dihydroorotate oxidase [Apilactobacillus ozensis]KRM68081.1 dihydroorotate dehydrogenase [Apilactobacillus ozensis DSM 23829 = JCM 17196]MCK8606586.1 dihydroorotate oxidase [Apilactobacillus ozensis]